ncbi:glycosyltransferase family 2 protein [Lachnospira multipara]|uniref:glycosyltransferase family 2 protein n=1 Tax=Lachnospira multipara TaxID=28051 RepID=UPI00041674CB|nr:glycosyltransferase family 2 protein [Lachnospira multipara]
MKQCENIDKVRFRKIDNKMSICVAGWYHKEIKKDSFKVILNGKEHDFTYNCVERDDVINSKEEVELADCGFVLRVESNDIKDMEVQLIDEDKIVNLVRLDSKDITYSLEKQTIETSIDSIVFENEEDEEEETKLVFAGWVATNTGENISFEVNNYNNEKVEFELEEIDREDLLKRGYLEGEFRGFRISIVDNSANYCLNIKSGDNYKTVDIGKQLKKNRNRYRRHMLITLIKHITPYNIYRTLRYIFKHGFKGIKTMMISAIEDESRVTLNDVYPAWFKQHQVTEEELEEQRQVKFDYEPKISVLVPTYNTPIDLLEEMVDSVRFQSYSNWELCIADGSITNQEVRDRLAAYVQEDKRIKVKYLDKNYGISGNTNAALELATGDLVGLLDHDDTLELDLFYEVVKAFQEEEVDIVYTDEDKIMAPKWINTDPNFKPDFSIDLFRSHNYITHFFACKKRIIDEVGGFRSEFDGSQDYDLMFRCIEKSRKIVHVPKILYHWRMIEGSTAADPKSKLYCFESGRAAVQAHLDRIGVKGHVEIIKGLWGMYHTVYDVIGSPLISIIIPNKDLTKDLDKCIRSIQTKSTYRNFEFIIVENNSTEKETFEYYDKIQEEFDNVKVIKWEKGFNYSAINNYGAQFAKGEYLLLLNNDTELITPTALEEMLGICMRDEVGIVGAKLLYADNTVQHAGVVIGFGAEFGGYAGHVFNGIGRKDYGYMLRPRLNCNYSAVTAACLMTKRSVFDEVEGLREEFVVACNDVDYCLKVREKGYLVVYNAFAEWHHYESKSRGYEDTPEKKERFLNEVHKFQKIWPDILKDGDPYYNKNFPIDYEPYMVRVEKESSL